MSILRQELWKTSEAFAEYELEQRWRGSEKAEVNSESIRVEAGVVLYERPTADYLTKAKNGEIYCWRGFKTARGNLSALLSKQIYPFGDDIQSETSEWLCMILWLFIERYGHWEYYPLKPMI